MKVNEIIINGEQQYVGGVDGLCVINVAMGGDGHEREGIVAAGELKDGAICILKGSNLDVFADYGIDIYAETIPLKMGHIDIVRTSSEPRLRSGSLPITGMLKDWGNGNFSFFKRDGGKYGEPA